MKKDNYEFFKNDKRAVNFTNFRSKKKINIKEYFCSLGCNKKTSQTFHVEVNAGKLWRCNVCKSFSIYPKRSQDLMSEIHLKGNFNHTYFIKRRNKFDKYFRNKCRSIILSTFKEKKPKGKKILDVGCDTGSFLEIAKEEFGVVPSGVEVSENAAKICKEKGLNIFNCDIHHLKTKKKFDAIFLNDLIEHVASPSVLIKIISELLVSNGRIYICTPNAKALIFQLGKILHFVFPNSKMLNDLFVVYHENYFSEFALKELFINCNYKIISHSFEEVDLKLFSRGWFLKLVLYTIFKFQKFLNLQSNQVLIVEKNKCNEKK